MRNQEWSTLFGSSSFVLDNSAPLWFATFNNVEVRNFLFSFYHRWFDF